jgi:glycolate oxidase FAD binding subunit
MIESLNPATAEELAEALAEASAERRPVTPWGAGAHQHLGLPARPDALVLHTGRLSQVLEYTPADLTVTVGAGARLADLQESLRPHGQWLPWDPPGAALATVGGLLAAGRSGPLRLGYGTPRDWLLGARVALGDGRLVKSGGRVVKNVAGYDTHKLQIGALGTLGVLVSVTLKLAPLPERTATLAVACGQLETLLEAAELLRQPPLSPDRLVVMGAATAESLITSAPRGSGLVLARYAGVDTAVERQLREARASVERLAHRHAGGVTDLRLADLAGSQAAHAIDVLQGDAWGRLVEFPTPDGAELVLRAGVRPAMVGALAQALEQHAPRGSLVIGYPGVGLAHARWQAVEHLAPEVVARSLAGLRAVLAPLDGYVVVEAAPIDLRAALDLWGPPPASLPIMHELKRRWDPAGILNPGRYLAGL